MDPVDDLIGQSARMVALREQVRGLLERERAMRRLPPVLIVGETGTGKGLLASVIHRASSRAGGQFVEASCAALPDTLIESELFGYERGAFTDARQSKPGLMQMASDGTLFLDEIGLLSPLGQGKLLNGLEDAHGCGGSAGSGAETVNVSIIARHQRRPHDAVHERRFREDLYHRLAVIVLALPPLRDRGGDIDLLAARALAQVCAEYALPAKRLSTGARDMLRAHHWPGNVRELNNVLRRVAHLFGEPVITGRDAGARRGVGGSRRIRRVGSRATERDTGAHRLEHLPDRRASRDHAEHRPGPDRAIRTARWSRRAGTRRGPSS